MCAIIIHKDNSTVFIVRYRLQAVKEAGSKSQVIQPPTKPSSKKMMMMAYGKKRWHFEVELRLRSSITIHNSLLPRYLGRLEVGSPASFIKTGRTCRGGRSLERNSEG